MLRLKTRNYLSTALFMAAGCTGTISDANPATDPDPDPDQALDGSSDVPRLSDSISLVTESFTESDEQILNPERGFYSGVDLLDPDSAALVRERDHTLAIAIVRLDAFRELPLSAAFLTDLENGLASVRQAGVKLILRFTYNASFSDDASKSIILQHLGQLTPLLQDNGDVIAIMQAGFIGAWGEWHGSTHGLDNDNDREEILTALLAALPTSRQVQVRTPMFKAAAWGPSPLEEDEAWSSTARARVGHHNDCFLASDNDLGTYASPVDDWLEYLSDDTRFTAMGGETCKVNAPRTDCPVALSELQSHHWSYLNSEYKQEVLSEWETQGCGDDIARLLGYRFALISVTHSETAAAGGILDLELRIANRGFSAPINERPVYIAISRGNVRKVARLEGLDARRWGPQEVSLVSTRLRIPSDIDPGTYSVSLWLPDAQDSLASDPRYAIQMANEGVWDDSEGDNVLSNTLFVEAPEPGSTHSPSSELVEIP